MEIQRKLLKTHYRKLKGIKSLPLKNVSPEIPIRSDLLSAYYDSKPYHQCLNRYGNSLVDLRPEIIDLSREMNNFPREVINIFRVTGKLAEKYQIETYVTGGFVRDLLLRRNNKDLDLVITGDLENFIRALADRLGGEWSYNREFHTGNIQLSTGFNLDLAESRREYYPRSGALPEVELADLLEDLFRRDFTVNTFLLVLKPDGWGRILDFFQGSKDVERGLLRVLHRFSFLDDPTRIIRGIRLAVRLGFAFARETKALLKEALTVADFSTLSAPRVLKELRLLFADRVTPGLLRMMQEFPLFKLLNLEIEIKADFFRQFKELEAYLEYFQEKNYNIKVWLLRMAVFLEDIHKQEIEEWGLSALNQRVLSSYARNRGILSRLNRELDPVELVKLLKGLTTEEIILLLVKGGKEKIKENLLYHLEELADREVEINGFDLQEMGLKPGPEIKDILQKVYHAKLRGELKNRREELAFAEKLIRDGSD